MTTSNDRVGQPAPLGMRHAQLAALLERTAQQRADAQGALRCGTEPHRPASEADGTPGEDGLSAPHRFALARMAAAHVLHHSVQMELNWIRHHERVDGQPRPTTGHRVEDLTNEVLTAPGYTVNTFRAGVCSGRPRGSETVRRARARSMLRAWSRHQGATIHRDDDGRLFVDTDWQRQEFVPTALAPPHTEGDVLRAALKTYGLPAYDEGESGVSWLVVPLGPNVDEKNSDRGLHYRVASGGEHADRPASQHGAQWTAGLYDGFHFVNDLPMAPGAYDFPQDCAFTARGIADDIIRATRS